MANSNSVGLMGNAQPVQMLVDFTITGSAAANTVIQGTIYPFGLSQPSQTSIVVPSKETWYLTDVSVNKSLSVDLQFQLTVDGVVQPLAIDLNSTIVTNSGRYKMPIPFKISANSTFSVSAINFTANSATTAVTESATLSILRVGS